MNFGSSGKLKKISISVLLQTKEENLYVYQSFEPECSFKVRGFPNFLRVSSKIQTYMLVKRLIHVCYYKNRK